MQRTNTAVTALFNKIIGRKYSCMKLNFCFAEVPKNGTGMETHVTNCEKSGDNIKYKNMTTTKLPVGLTRGQSQGLDGTIVATEDAESHVTRVGNEICECNSV